VNDPALIANRRTRSTHRHVHLMADYGSVGVWDHDGAPLDPARLPLSPKLCARLIRWCTRFQQSFETEIDLDAFASEGRAARRFALGLSWGAYALRGRDRMSGQVPPRSIRRVRTLRKAHDKGEPPVCD
jgi:hypothetical protein